MTGNFPILLSVHCQLYQSRKIADWGITKVIKLYTGGKARSCMNTGHTKALPNALIDSYGSISPGKRADVVLLDKEGLEQRQVILGGKPVQGSATSQIP